MRTVVYMPVRENEDHVWVHAGCCGLTRELAKAEAAKIDAEIPGWAKANPVIRIGRFECIETENRPL